MPLKIIPSNEVPPPGEAFRGSVRKAAEADIILVVRGDAVGVIKCRRPLMVTHHERNEDGSLVFALRYRDR
ncbi:hypothetical protein LCGC14_1184350 [marine sediment metagenome]|uniref:Uncharacterized protein n=1 Tax=marine sediment metagenome TaxID=412755 RepID=A0A0F9LR08_9ZZZZ